MPDVSGEQARDCHFREFRGVITENAAGRRALPGLDRPPQLVEEVPVLELTGDDLDAKDGVLRVKVLEVLPQLLLGVQVDQGPGLRDIVADRCLDLAVRLFDDRVDIARAIGAEQLSCGSATARRQANGPLAGSPSIPFRCVRFQNSSPVMPSDPSSGRARGRDLRSPRRSGECHHGGHPAHVAVAALDVLEGRDDALVRNLLPVRCFGKDGVRVTVYA
ncbi:hypothetical protein [Streptomyces sp. NPDC056641]|uniref:hypothetical protein n=1 Tax=unclassified Streptomyces TaxID=2593676 RepID=UPI0036CB6A5C